MMDEIPQQPVTVAEVARVGIDLPCITCGYNLRSLPMSGRCTECNSSIESTLHHGWLMFADPRWLKRLRSGVTLILWILLATVLSYVGSIVALVVIIVPGGPTPDELVFLVPVMVIGVSIATAWLISAFKLTTPEPPHATGGWPRRRGVAKWTLGLNVLATSLFVCSAFCVGLMMMVFPGLLKPDAVLVSVVIGGYIASLTSMVGFLLLMILMRRLARRVPRCGLGKLMSVLIWGSVGLNVGWVVTVLFSVGAALFVVGSGMMIPTTTSAPAGVAALGYTALPAPMSRGSATRPASVYTSTTIYGSTGFTTTTTTGPATGAPITMPIPTGGYIGFIGGGWYFGFLFIVIIELAVLGWGVCGLVALFWFRSVFGRAIAQSAAHPFHAVP